jgi:hypothetical protein
MKPSVHEPSAAVADSGWGQLYEADDAELALHWISAFNSAPRSTTIMEIHIQVIMPNRCAQRAIGRVVATEMGYVPRK